jgi:hypothetical protein
MKPDRTNYEIWLIDYLDGSLDEGSVNQLVAFLEENPDIKNELSDILDHTIKPLHDSFKNKKSLKKSVTDLSDIQFEYLCIAACENDLSDEHKEELETIVTENPDKGKTLETIKRLKLVAPAVKYNSKSRLRRLTTTQKIVRFSSIGLSAAAGIALMISLYNLPSENKEDFRSLATTSVTGDSIKTNNNSVNNTFISNTGMENKAGNSIPRNILSTLQQIESEDIKAVNVDSLANGLPESKSETGQINISKIAFIQDVELCEKEFISTLIAINTNEVLPPEEIESPGFNDFIAKIFREKILKSGTPEKGNIKAYEVADASIIGLNKLLGWQMSLQKTRDEKGDLKSLYFSSKILKFNAPVKKIQL